MWVLLRVRGSIDVRPMNEASCDWLERHTMASLDQDASIPVSPKDLCFACSGALDGLNK